MCSNHGASLPATGFVRLALVLKLIPVCRTKWFAGIKEGRFPKPVHLGPRTSAYRVEDIRALIEQLGASEQQEG